MCCRRRTTAGTRALHEQHERDERDVAQFEALLAEQARWEALLAEAEVLPTVPSDGAVTLGARVRITLADGSKAWVRPVHPAEAFLDDERISVGSPLGSALLGAVPGDVVTVDAPVGTWECTVVSIEGVRRRRRATAPTSQFRSCGASQAFDLTHRDRTSQGYGDRSPEATCWSQFKRELTVAGRSWTRASDGVASGD